MSVILQSKEKDYLKLNEHNKITPNEKLIEWMTEVNIREAYIFVDFIKSHSPKKEWIAYEIDPPF